MDAKMQIRLPKEMYEKFKEIAEGNAQVPSLLVRQWIKDYINKNQEEETKMREIDVRVSSDWLKENMETLYDGILEWAEFFAEDEFNSFSPDDLEELKEGFEADISVSRFGDKWKIATYINGDTVPWFYEDLDTYPKNEVTALMHLAE